MNQSNWTVGEYLWHQVKSLGITKVPGIPGDVILPLMDQGYESGIEFIGCENEQNAGYIGDGMARQHGVAAFITTTAVGSLSAFNATASSAAEKVGVIHISGGLPSHLYGKRELVHHSIGGDLYKNREAFKVITNGRAEVLLDPETAPDIIDSLLTYSATYSEPCFIEVPVDIGAKPCRAPEPLLPVVETSDPRSLQQARAALTKFISDKPNRLLIPGFLLKRLKLEQEAQQLLDETGLPFTTLLTDKGLFSERHPQFCGTYLGVASAAEFQDFFNESDLYINLGCWLTDIQSICGSIEMPADKTVLVHENALEIGGERFEGIPMIESINLLQQVLGMDNTRVHPQAEQMQAYAGQFNRPMQESLSVDGFFEMLSTAIKSEDHIVVEAGTALFSGCGLLLPEGASYDNAAFWASIGQSAGSALGAALANPDKTVLLLIGDGSLQEVPQVISSAIRHQANLKMLVLNNNGYEIERAILDNYPYNDIASWNFSLMQRAMGGSRDGIRVTNYAELGEAFIEMRKDRAFQLIEVMLPQGDGGKVMKEVGESLRFD